MPIYHQLGRVPRKRHVAFRKEGGGIYYEELIGNQGFTGLASLLYHLRLPTAVKSVQPVATLEWVPEPERVVRHRHFKTKELATGPSAVRDRVPLLFNDDVALQLVRPRKDDAVFYRNAQGDEVVFVVEGEGVLESSFGELAYRAGDYVVIPRGILHRWRLARGPAAPPRDREPRLRADAEALPQRARPAHRDGALQRARHPQARAAEPHDEAGDFRCSSRAATGSSRWCCRTTPSTSWAGTATTIRGRFSIHDFEPRVGRVHLPPPVHQTFEGDGFVRLLVLPAALRLRAGRGLGALQPPERDVGRGAVLRERRVHEPQGHRARLDHAPPRRPAARPAARARRRSRSAPRARTSWR